MATVKIKFRPSTVVLHSLDECRKRYLLEIDDKIRTDIKHFQSVIADFEHSGLDYTADDVIAQSSSDNPDYFFFPFVISEGMGHDSETTTRIYLASLDTVAIDNANSMILKSL